MLGVSVRDSGRRSGRKLRVDRHRRALVAQVARQPAAKAGIKANDIITQRGDKQ
jgi:S1-C subfamily serine protease